MKKFKLGLGGGKNEERVFYKESEAIAIKGLKCRFELICFLKML